MEIPQTIKENPIKSLVSVITLVTTIASAVLFVDSRYVLAADFEEVQQQMGKQIESLREKDLTDKIFILKFKIENGTATPLDKALKERYESELKHIQGN